MKRWIIALLVLALVAGGAWAWGSPQYTVWQLKRAAEARDADAVAGYVDFPAVRESLKAQLRGRLAKPTGRGMSVLESMGATIASRFADPIVDAAVTPEGMRAIFAARTTAKSEAPAMGLKAEEMVLRRDSIDRFRLVRTSGGGGELVFKLRGLGWKLVEIRVPEDAGKLL